MPKRLVAFRKRATQSLVLSLAAILVAVGLTACGGGSSHPVSYGLPGYGPYYNGQQYCAYVVTPLECQSTGIASPYWYAMPAYAPPGYPIAYTYAYGQNLSAANLIFAMYFWHLSYHSWYASPSYYNHYVPAGRYRSTYVTRVRTFDRTNAATERTAASHATYRGSNGKVVPANKVPSNVRNGSKLVPESKVPAKTSSNNGGGSTKTTAPKNNGGKTTTKKGCNKFVQLSGNSAGYVQIAARPGGGGTHFGGNSKPKPPAPKHNSGGGGNKKAGSNNNGRNGGSGC